MVQQRMMAFRDFAGRLAAQVVEQMCQEFEREVGELWNDVCMYRDELDRVAQLLGGQLEREKQLHNVIEGMVGHGNDMRSKAQYLAQQRTGTDNLHQMLEQHAAHHQNLLSQTLQGVTEGNQVLGAYYQGAQQFKEPLISAENEFIRIVELLKTPPIHGAMPSSTGFIPTGAPNEGIRSFTPPPTGQSSSPGMVYQPVYSPPQRPFSQSNASQRAAAPWEGVQPQMQGTMPSKFV